MLDWWGTRSSSTTRPPRAAARWSTPADGGSSPAPSGSRGQSEIRILDDNAQPCQHPGHRLHQASARPTSSTQGDRKKTERRRRAGFFTVGDVGYLDDDGYLFLCDRKTDMIISGGVNIYPAEIEAVLLAHPKVGDVAVFGVPHDGLGRGGEGGDRARGRASTPSDGAARGDPGLREDRLAKYKTPTSIDFLAELPRDPNGKLYKRKLRDPYWAGRDRAI